MILALLDEAVGSGARFELACDTIGLTARTVQRWKETPDSGDERAGPNTKPAHALTPEEREQIVTIATAPEYRNLSVRQLVPLLADEGIFVASESTFYRVLHEEKLVKHRVSGVNYSCRSATTILAGRGHGSKRSRGDRAEVLRSGVRG